MSPRECKVQAVPKCDGTFRVSGDLSNTGILPGWIQTEGVAPGKATCSWARLSSATFSLASTIDGGSAKADDPVQPIRVQVQPSDHSFYTKGCLPWRKVG